MKRESEPPFARLHWLTREGVRRGIPLLRGGPPAFFNSIRRIDDEALKELVSVLVPLGSVRPEVAALFFLLPEHSDDDRWRLAEIAGPEAALQIGKEYAEYRKHRVLMERKSKKRLEKTIAAVEGLQKLRLTPLDLALWGMPEDLLEIRPGEFFDWLADVLKSSPLASRAPGRPREEDRKLLAVSVAQHLDAAGVAVSNSVEGPVAEVLAILLKIDDPGRLVRHAIRVVRSDRSIGGSGGI